MSGWLQRVVLKRRWATFVVMGLSFLVFGIGSLNLFYVARASINFVLEHGWVALMDGAALQLLEIVVTGYFCIAAYVLFKTCEHRLVHWLAGSASTTESTKSP